MRGLAPVVHNAACVQQGICRAGGPFSLHNVSCCSFIRIRDSFVRAEKSVRRSKEEYGYEAISDPTSSETRPGPIEAVSTMEKVLTMSLIRSS